jgi:hypothetical protein
MSGTVRRMADRQTSLPDSIYHLRKFLQIHRYFISEWSARGPNTVTGFLPATPRLMEFA